MSQYILFYSKKCKHSITLLNVLHKIGIRHHFTLISADREKNGNRTPYLKQFGIDRVPTVIVDEQKYVGNDALRWLRNVISDMGLRGPPAIASRANKEFNSVNPRYNEEDRYQDGYQDDDDDLPGYDNGAQENFAPIDNQVDGRINYIPEDGNSHSRHSGLEISHQSILPPDEARALDIKLLRKGSTGGRDNDNDRGGRRKRSGLKQDSLKTKRHESEYAQYMQERDSEIPQPRRRQM